MANDPLSYFYSSYKRAQRYNSNMTSRFQGSDPISNKSQVQSSDPGESISELQAVGRGIFKAVVGVGILLNLKKIARFFVNFAGKYAHIRYKSLKGKVVTLRDYLLSKNPGKISEIFGDVEFDSTLESRADNLEQKFQDIVSATDTFIKNIGTGKNMSSNAPNSNSDDQTDDSFDKYSNYRIGVEKYADSKSSNFIKNSVTWSNSDVSEYPAARLFFMPGIYAIAASHLKNIVESHSAKDSEKQKLISKIDSFVDESSNISKETNDIIEKISKKSEESGKNKEKNASRNDNSINKITKYSMSDQFAKSYYKDALRGLESNDSLMKEFYKGMANFYDDEQSFNDSRKNNELYDLSLDQDLVQEAHPHKLYVSKGFGEGGLVENGHQAKKRMVGVARRNPSGNFKNN